MKARTFASVAVMTALGLLAPIHAHAFGLGKIELSSSLNEPFKAEIAVTALRGDDEGELQVQLASNSEFEKAGLKRTFLLTQLSFDIVEKNGETKIKISSSQPVKEPFIDFLLTATTGNGRLIREYTVLLDPPKNVFVKPVSAPQQTKPSTVKKKVKPAPQKSTYKYPDPEMPTSVSYSSATSYGPVERTDTLSQIARDTKPSSEISLNQMMMAILNANPESFRHQNINGLKAGYTLDIPSIAEIQSLSKSQAYAVVKEQHDLWKNRNRVVAEVPKLTEQENMSIASESITDGADIEKMVSDTTGETVDSQLQLVVPHDESSSEMDELAISGNKELTQLSEQLTLAQETIESQTQENIDIKSRMDMMEEQLQTLRRLITLKDADLARMQSTLDVDSTQVETMELEPSNIDMMEGKLAEEMAEAEATDVDNVEAEVTDAEMTEVEASEVEMTEPETAEIDMAAAESEAFSAEQSEVEAYFSQIGSETNEFYNEDKALVEVNSEIDTTAKLPLEVADNFIKSSTAKVKAFYIEHKKESLIGGLVAALFALILLLVRRKRRNQSFTWDDVEAANTTVAVDTKQTDSTTVEVSESNVSNTAEETESAEEEIESVADKTDEDMIKDAYASIENIDVDSEKEQEIIELEQEALNITEEMSSDLEELNISEVEEPLELDYTATEPEPEPESESDEEITLDFNQADLSSDTPSEDETSLEFNADELSIETIPEELEDNSENESTDSDDLLEFNLETDSNDSDEESVLDLDELVVDNDDDNTLDFGESLSLDSETDNGNELNLDDSLSLDIDSDLLSELDLDDSPISLELPEDSESNDVATLNLDEESDHPEVADLSEVLSVPSDVPEQEESKVEFDLGDFDEIDEAETKLDLAGAYMDMGDPEGARNILEEVILEGDEEQKSRAQSLLNDLS